MEGFSLQMILIKQARGPNLWPSLDKSAYRHLEFAGFPVAEKPRLSGCGRQTKSSRTPLDLLQVTI
jgi:hypothetical protein